MSKPILETTSLFEFLNDTSAIEVYLHGPLSIPSGKYYEQLTAELRRRAAAIELRRNNSTGK
jgi:hypothetical protein